MSVKQEAICCIREAEKINKQATEDKVVHVTAAHKLQHFMVYFKQGEEVGLVKSL